jgi:hypothetical protein
MKAPDLSATVWRSAVPGCLACRERRVHSTSERYTYHPYSGHGYSGRQWSHPDLDPATMRGGTAHIQAIAAGAQP